MERRIHPVTKRVQVKVEPDGLPAIWIDEGHCERCEPYGECLGLLELTDTEWETAQNLIKEVEKTEVRNELSAAGFTVKKCG